MLLLLGAMVLAAGSGLVLWDRERAYLEPVHSAANEQKTLTLLSATVEDIISEDLPRLETTIEEVANSNRDLQSVRVVDRDGQELVTWSRSEVPQAVKYWYVFESSYPLERFAHNISFEGDVYGTMTIEWDRTRAGMAADKHAYMMAFAAALIAFLAAVIGFRLGRSRG